MPKLGEEVVGLLEACGVDHVFGIPGVHNVELYRGLAASRITHVTPRHEQGAGFMAYGYAVATGRPGVCFVISGPGLTNIATAMGEAYSDSIPMLVIATNNETSQLGLESGRLHETKSQTLIAEQLTAATHRLLDPGNLAAVLGSAISSFAADRPRPVCVEIPLNLLAQDVRVDKTLWPTAARPAPDPRAIAAAAHMLGNAVRPILLVGGGAVDAAEDVRALCRMLDAPVVTTTAGKGVVSEDDPLSLGASLPFKPVQDYLAKADAVLAIGTELGETDTLYTYSRYDLAPNLIRVDIDPAQVGRNFRPAIPIVSDAALAVDALRERLKGVRRATGRTAGAGIVQTLKSAMTGQWIPGADAHKAILDSMREALGDDAIVAADECQLGYTACQYFKNRTPRGFIYGSGFGTLGIAVPAAIGAKIGRPDCQVAAITGDGSLLFTVSELMAAAELKLGIPVIIWNNRGYKEIAYEMDRKGVTRIGVDLAVPDFAALAQAFRCHFEQPSSLAGFRDAFRRAFDRPGPTLIELDADAPFLR